MSAAWTPEVRRLTAGGRSLEYRCWGPPPDAAPTIVMLHERLGCIELWRDTPERLAAATGFGVVAYSRAGYGASDPADLPRPLDYQTIEGTGVLGDVLDALAIENGILLGHSDGATMAAIYAGSVSDQRVRGLVLIAPHFFTESSGLAAIAQAGQAFREGSLKAKLAKYHGDPDNAFNGWYDAWTHPEYAAWDVSDVIDHWRIPVLAIQGDADPYGTLAQVEEIAIRIYSPLETLIVKGGGHAPHLDQSAEVDGAITEFCARLHRLERTAVPFH